METVCPEPNIALNNFLALIQAIQQRDREREETTENIVFETSGVLHCIALSDLIEVATCAAYAGRDISIIKSQLEQALSENSELRVRLIKLRNAFGEELSKPL